jgi:ABC-type polysaccharide/polyol phosphate transport system ATPase subunit
VGPNGAGKSTLLASIAGVLKPSRGTIALEGRVAPVIEPEVGPHRDFSGREHLMVTGVLLGMRRRELRERIPSILELSGIGEQVLEKPLRTYSTGMVARLEFALAMRSDASVVVLDEHLGAVDESFRARLAAGLDELSARGGAVVLASHDLELVKDLCDRAALVERGSLTDVGPAAEIVEGYARRRATGGLAAVPPEHGRTAAIG